MFDKTDPTAAQNIDQARDKKDQTAPRRDPLPMDDARMALVAQLDPTMVPVLATLSYPPEGDMPTEFPAHSSAFETLNSSYPGLAMAISTYVRSDVHHSESMDKLIENASRAMFKLAPMNDADERAWMHRHDIMPLPVAVNADHPVPAIAKQWADPKKGPTVAEWVAAGYLAKDYPPFGYDSQSTREEIAAAVADETAGEAKIEASKMQPQFAPLEPMHPEPPQPLSV